MMNVDRLIKELEDIVNNASSVPLTNKVMVDGEEVISILNEIEKVLPDEIKQARWIQNERDRILTEAKKEYETVVNKCIITIKFNLTNIRHFRSCEWVKTLTFLNLN